MSDKKKKKTVVEKADSKKSKKAVAPKTAKKTSKKSTKKKNVIRNKDGSIRKKMGRPLVKIEWKDFEKLCAIHCTLIEIAEWFGCSDDTIERQVKKKYGETFAVVYKRKSGKGKTSLRRKQVEVALSGNVKMLIWLGIQHLGQIGKQAQGTMGKDGELQDPGKKENITPEMTDKEAEYIYIRTVRDKKNKK